MSSIDALNLRIPVRSPTLTCLDLSLTTLIDITGKRKQILTCTHETTKVKIVRLCSVRFIHGDHQITTRYAKALLKTKGLISLLATRLSNIKPIN
jgi:hypothetical protein